MMKMMLGFWIIQNEGDMPLGKVKMMFRDPRNMIMPMMKVYARFELR